MTILQRGRLKKSNIDRVIIIFNGSEFLQVCQLYRYLYGEGTNLQTSVNFRTFAALYLRLLKVQTWELYSVILRRSLQWCRRIFPNWSMSKVEKSMEGSIKGLVPKEFCFFNFCFKPFLTSRSMFSMLPVSDLMTSSYFYVKMCAFHTFLCQE